MRRSLAVSIPFARALALALALVAADARAADDQERCLSNSEDAQRLRYRGRLREARERFLACARAECPAVVQQDCEHSLADVEARLPTVILAARDSRGRDVQDARVFLDGELVPPGLEGRSITVDPGAHTVRYEAAGFAPTEEHLVMREGEKQRLFEVRLVAMPPPAPATRSTSTSTIAFAAPAFAGAAVVATGLGAFFGIRALDGYQSMKDRCQDTRACSHEEASTVRAQAIASDVAFGIALACGSVAAWLYFRRTPSAARDLALRGTF